MWPNVCRTGNLFDLFSIWCLIALYCKGNLLFNMDMINMETEDKGSCTTEVDVHNTRSVLLTEFVNWGQKKNNVIKLLQDSLCEDGRICLEFSIGKDENFTLLCPSEYPNYEDHFFVEATPPLQFWCNALNEFILDADVLLSLDMILEKAASLYCSKKSNNSPCLSSSDSDPEVDLGEEFMVVDGDSEEGEEWEHVLCQRKKRWRMKEAEIRAITKQPKTSDMFDGNVKDHPKQVFSNSAASGILMNDLITIMESKHKTGINAEPIADNIYKWAVFLSSFDSQGNLNHDLQQLYQKYGYDYIQLQLDFTLDLYPFYPPVVKVVRPRLQGSMMLRIASMDMLKLSHWNPTRNMKSVLQEIKDYLGTWARIDLSSDRNDLQFFPQGAYIEMENYLLWLAWVSEIPSRAHQRSPEAEPETSLSHAPESERKKCHEKSLFPAGTGYSSPSQEGWNLNAYMSAQREKDKQIECVLQKILQELRKSSDSNKEHFGTDDTCTSFIVPSCSSHSSVTEGCRASHFKTMHDSNHVAAAPKKQCLTGLQSDSDLTEHKQVTPSEWNAGVCSQQNGKSPVDPTEDLFTVLEASTLVPFLESKLQVDSFLEICRHTEVYRCVVEIISEIASRPKLVRLLWTLPDQVQSIYTLVTRLEEKAKAILLQITKTSANGNIPCTTSAKQKNASSTLKTNNKNFFMVSADAETTEEERLARDFYQMSHTVSTALRNEGLLATCDEDQSPSTSQQSPVPQSPAAGTLDYDQALTATYKEALKDLQFLSCDIEVEGASAHQFSTHFKKALPPNSAQVIRIAQEMAALSTSLPLDIGSAIFIRTDDAKCTLLRALIIGPEGTPYSGGCFQFDIFFPPQYPKSPPLVHFCTTGRGQVRFNPNLYSSGRVCLSLLDTFVGLQGEHWHETSTLLQVLVSIQSLILVPEPYFNEPGYEILLGTAKGKRCSQSYNEDVLLQTVIHAMVSQLRKPSSGFEDVIHTHFWIKKKRILTEIKAHLKTHNNTKALQRAYESLCAELNKLTPVSSKKTDDTALLHDPV